MKKKKGRAKRNSELNIQSISYRTGRTSNCENQQQQLAAAATSSCNKMNTNIGVNSKCSVNIDSSSNNQNSPASVIVNYYYDKPVRDLKLNQVVAPLAAANRPRAVARKRLKPNLCCLSAMISFVLLIGTALVALIALKAVNCHGVLEAADSDQYGGHTNRLQQASNRPTGGASPNRHWQNHQIVFPTPAAAAASNANTKQHQAAHAKRHQASSTTIYVNPQPSTSSRGRFAQPSVEPTSVASNNKLELRHQLGGATSANLIKLANNNQQQQQQHNHRSIGSTPSSIGKNERSQVAEWPFFKSIQSVRSSQLMNQQQQASSTTTTSSEPAATPSSSSSSDILRFNNADSSMAGGGEPVAGVDELAPPAGSASTSGLTLDDAGSTSSVTPTIVTAASSTTSTTTSAPATAVPMVADSGTRSTESATKDDKEVEDAGQPEEEPENKSQQAATNSTPAPFTSLAATSTSTTSTTTTTTTTSTTTTPEPTTTATEASGTMAPQVLRMATTSRDQLDEMAMFSPKYHKSIQTAVNRIVELGAAAKRVQPNGSKQNSIGGDLDDNGDDRGQKARERRPDVVRLRGGTAAGVVADNALASGNGTRVRSSLSLNVLLKNFGALNLTSLDQILLKSSLNNKNNKSRADVGANEQKIQINGVHRYESVVPISTTSQGAGSEPNSNSDSGLASVADGDAEQPNKTAECKIEYTMKHVNISLVNDDKSDYTCDYIIDRNLGRAQEEQEGGVSSGARAICKLHIRSKFFEHSPWSGAAKSDGAESEATSSICSGATYLSIGKMKFCHMMGSSRGGDGDMGRKILDRVFNFPVDKEAFDIKLVHKSAPLAESASAENGEIYLEIKPIVDENTQCTPAINPSAGVAGQRDREQPERAREDLANSGHSHHGDDENSDSSADPLAPLKPISALTRQRQQQQQQPGQTKPREEPDNRLASDDGVGSPQRVALTNGSPKRKFIVKVAPEKHLHPLNNKIYHNNLAAAAKPRPAADRPVGGTDEAGLQQAPVSRNRIFGQNGASNEASARELLHMADSLPLCNDIPTHSGQGTPSVHVSTIGQLTTPNYPGNYTTNIRCRHVIKRVSPAYCRLLLHFRDFDLITGGGGGGGSGGGGGTQNKSPHCVEDYLQIGETRYCNRYAMIGHKMYLDFQNFTELLGLAGSGQADLAALDLAGPIDETITLIFNSDQTHTGRGFLIKYQQLRCDMSRSTSSGASGSSSQHRHELYDRDRKLADRRLGAGETASQNFESGPAKLATLAPPVQQPDFSLALKAANNKRSQQQASSDQRQQEATGNQPEIDRSAAGGLPSPISSSPLLLPMATSTSPTRSSLPPSQPGARSLPGQPESGRSFATSTVTSITKRNSLEGSNTVNGNQRFGQQMSDETPPEVQTASPACNQVNYEMSFLMSSYNYPEPYANNLQCLYYVRRNSSRVCYLELTFIKFDLEPDSDCRYDYLEINNVRLCGSLRDLNEHKTSRIYLFDESVKLLKFKSDSVATRAGFLIKADQLECASNGAIERRHNLQSQAQRALGQISLGLDKASMQSPGAGDDSSVAYEPVPSPVSRSNSSRVFEYDSSLLGSKGNDQARFAQSQRPASGHLSSVFATSSAGGDQERQQRQQQSFLNETPASTQLGPQQPPPAAASALAASGSGNCDDLLFGTEVTIRSPGWPESYTNDATFNGCKYTIVRNKGQAAATATSSSNRNKSVPVARSICQLELRFVHLRLGFGDCLDVDGMELLCGFNTRNLVKYYPLGERQSHLTITFTTVTAKLAAARSVNPSDSSPANYSDLLPSLRAPHRFLLIARQLECIDDFLAPQVDLEPLHNSLVSGRYAPSADTSTVNASSTRTRSSNNGSNSTSGFASPLQFYKSDQDFSGSLLPPLVPSNSNNRAKDSVKLAPTSLITDRLSSGSAPLSPRYANRTSSSGSDFGSSFSPTSSFKDSKFVLDSVQLKQRKQHEPQLGGFVNESVLSYDQPLVSSSSSSTGGSSNFSRRPSASDGVLIYSFASSIASSSNSASDRKPSSSLSSSGHCLIQLMQYNGILTAAQILARLESIKPNKPLSEQQLLQADSGAQASRQLSRDLTSECEIRLKLLPGYCKLQLTFGEFDLYPARLDGSLLCVGENLELAGVQYCGQELRNASRILTTTLPGQRHISLRTTLASPHAFRAIFKQLECDASPLSATDNALGASDKPAPLGASRLSFLSNGSKNDSNPQQKQKQQRTNSNINTIVAYSKAPESISSDAPKVDLRQISISEEFFELNSAQLSPDQANAYEPNMFVVYHLQRARPSVCKIRLMFYKFQMEPATRGPGGLVCSRDFLDIDNTDRLCGSLDVRSSDSSREYDWPLKQGDEANRPFKISFVSDSNDQRAGFHIFGQQISDPLVCANHVKPTAETNSNKSDQSEPNGSNKDTDHDRPSESSKPAQTDKNDAASGKSDSSNKSDKSHQHHEQHQEMVPSGDSNKRAKASSTLAQLPANCSAIIDDLNFELSSLNWPRPYRALGTCHYLIRRSSSANICSVTLRVNSMILDIDRSSETDQDGSCNSSGGGQTDAATGSDIGLSSTDYLELDGQTRLCGLLSRPRSFTFDFVSDSTSSANSQSDRHQNQEQVQRQFIIAKFVSNTGRGFGFHIEGKQNKCPAATLKSVPSDGVTSDGGKDQDKDLAPLVKYDDTVRTQNQEQRRTSTSPPPTPTISDSDRQTSPNQNWSESAFDDKIGQEVGRGGQEADSGASSCNRLLTDQVNLIDSDKFPGGQYGNNLNCLFAVRRLNQSVCAIDLVFNYFDIENSNEFSGLCENDYVEIDYSRFCGTYPAGHKLRFNYYDNELDKLIRFRSDAATTRNGFSITVKQIMGRDCRSDIVSGPKMEGTDTPTESTRGSAGSQDDVINYLPNSTSGSSMQPERAPTSGRASGASSSGPMTNRNSSSSSPSSSEQQQPQFDVGVGALSQQPSSTLCRFVYHSERQLLVSPGYNAHRDHYDNNLDCQYKIVAASYDICSLKLTIMDLDLEQSQDCLNDYLLIDNRRYCGSLVPPTSSVASGKRVEGEGEGEALSNQTTTGGPVASIELDFSADLPREIDLILHTDSHVNSGRGFKLFSEQVACDPQRQQPERDANGPAQMTDQEFRIATSSESGPKRLPLDADSVSRARQVRRMRFGQLNYPRNYVSSPSSRPTALNNPKSQLKQANKASSATKPAHQHRESFSEAERRSNHGNTESGETSPVMLQWQEAQGGDQLQQQSEQLDLKLIKGIFVTKMNDNGKQHL